MRLFFCWEQSHGRSVPAVNLKSCSVWWAVRGAGKSSFFRLLAVQDDWFSDDLKKLDDENVYRKMQGHWLIEMDDVKSSNFDAKLGEIFPLFILTKHSRKERF